MQAKPMAHLYHGPSFRNILSFARSILVNQIYRVSKKQSALIHALSVLSIFLCSWDFIYAEYVMAAGYDHRSIVWQVNLSSTLLLDQGRL